MRGTCLNAPDPAAAADGNRIAGITLPNPASVALHEAVGFEAVGVYRRVGFKAGAWRDMGWWQRPLADPGPGTPADPGPPVRLG